VAIKGHYIVFLYAVNSTTPSLLSLPSTQPPPAGMHNSFLLVCIYSFFFFMNCCFLTFISRRAWLFFNIFFEHVGKHNYGISIICIELLELNDFNCRQAVSTDSFFVLSGRGSHLKTSGVSISEHDGFYNTIPFSKVYRVISRKPHANETKHTLSAEI
jgi:hypothetical protein